MTFTRDGKTQAHQPTLKLNLAENKLTGTLTRRNNQQDIEMSLEDAHLTNDDISFTVSVAPESGDGARMLRKFHGKIAGDTIIQGTVKEDWNGTDPSVEHPLAWEAKRVKE